MPAAAEIERLGAGFGDAWIDEAWDAYWDGVYGVCLREPTPENIVRKAWLIDRIDAFVAVLDELEMPFCDFDRAYFGRPVSRTST